SWLVFDYGGEVNDSVMGRAEDNPESFKLFDVGFEVYRLRFQFVLDFCDLLVVDLEFKLPLVSAQHPSER
ncbi:MAG: hypothetical protein RL069_941, partial [Planctomycetota bacterium]